MILKGRQVKTCLTALFLLAPAASAKINESPPIDRAAAATRWQWVGIKSATNSPCPIPAGANWSASELFTGMAETSPPPGLRPFCLYRYIGGGGVTPAAELELLALVGSGLQRIDSDVMAVSSSGKAATEVQMEMWQIMADHFADQVDTVKPVGSHLPHARLAVLDTAPTGVGFPLKTEGNSQHGYTLLHMAYDMLCPNDNCLAQISSRLTMPYITFDPADPQLSLTDTEHGGLIGTLSDLAQAIQGEMQQALYLPGDSTLWAEPDQPLARVVLNLSLGWDPIFGGLESDPQEMPANVRAVYAAIQDAVCRGAVLFAAAGNYREGPSESSSSEIGPLLPAAWESLPAPNQRRCGKVLEAPRDDDGNGSGGTIVDFDKSFDYPNSNYEPLIYAVGGLRSNGTPLANARQQGAPRLGAYADHAVVESHKQTKPTAMLTGSSVSSLVAAATAAGAWSLDSESTGQEIAQRLYEVGTPLARQADYCLQSSGSDDCPEVRRVSLCPTLQASCGLNGLCPIQIPNCRGWQTTAPYLDRNAMLLASAPRTEVDATELNQPVSPLIAAQCGSEERFSAAGSDPENPCPERQYFGLGTQAWLAPQPATDPCQTCTLFPNSCCNAPENAGDPGASSSRSKGKVFGNHADLLIDVDEDFEGVLKGATLTLCDVAYNFPLESLVAGDSAVITNLQVGDCASALLSFVVDELGTESASTTSAPLYAGSLQP